VLSTVRHALPTSSTPEASRLLPSSRTMPPRKQRSSLPPKTSRKKKSRVPTYETFDEALDGGVEQEEKGERYRVGDKVRWPAPPMANERRWRADEHCRDGARRKDTTRPPASCMSERSPSMAPASRAITTCAFARLQALTGSCA
jgi:hypothetical protein